MRRGLKIAFFGSSLVSAHLNPPAAYFRGIVRALHELGHEITFYEPDAFDRQRYRDLSDPHWAQVVVYPARSERDLYPLYTDAHTADLIIKAGHVGVFDELLEDALLNLRNFNNLAVFWDVTPSVTLDRLRRDPETPLRKLIPRYDLILTCGGGPTVVQAYQELGVRQCEVIYNALDPILYFPVERQTQFQSDLALYENHQPEREPRVEELFFRVASALPDRSFVLGGDGWQNGTLPENVRGAGHIYPRDYNAFNCTPKCVLHIAGNAHNRNPASPSSKIFEAAGAGACLITDEGECIENFLEPEREFLPARSREEVIDRLCATSLPQAREIGAAALRHMLAKHTYFHRAAQLERLIGASRLVRQNALC